MLCQPSDSNKTSQYLKSSPHHWQRLFSLCSLDELCSSEDGIDCWRWRLQTTNNTRFFILHVDAENVSGLKIDDGPATPPEWSRCRRFAANGSRLIIGTLKCKHLIRLVHLTKWFPRRVPMMPRVGKCGITGCRDKNLNRPDGTVLYSRKHKPDEGPLLSGRLLDM